METLIQIWERLNARGYGSDKGSVHSYLPIYEKLFEPYRETAKNILEIGLFNGHSMLMWEEYFKGNVYGIDCSETPHDEMADLRPMIEEGHRIHIMDAEDEREVEKRFKGMKFDVIIDDAGHHLEQQIHLGFIWLNYMTDDGVYIIEDIQNIEYAKTIFGSLNGELKKCFEIIDLRHVKNRYDDVLIVIKNK